MIKNGTNRAAQLVGVAGLGRVGLMSLFHLAERGFSPVGVDISLDRVGRLSKGEIPFFEPGFAELLKKHQEKITFVTDFRPARYWFIAVPTPFDKEKGEMDLSFVEKALRAVSCSGEEGPDKEKPYVFIRSTLSVGGLAKLSRNFKDLHLAYMPEFFREGCFVRDWWSAKFSVLACEKPDIFQPHFERFGFPPVETCRPEEGELLKLLSNLFHGLKVGFANEAGRLAQVFQASPHRIMELFTKEDRLNISKAYLKPGFSFSGPCLGKDIQSLSSRATAKLAEPVLPQSVLQSNLAHTNWVARRVLAFKPKCVSILGCSFTAHRTVDERSSGVLELAKRFMVT